MIIMELQIPMDYHLLFLAMSFIVFLVTIFLLFIDTTLEKAVAGFILCAFNIVLSLLCAFVFSAVDIYGYDSTGTIVHNIHGGMNSLSFIYIILIYVNVMLMVYCTFLFIRKPWTDVFGDETQIQYKGPSY